MVSFFPVILFLDEFSSDDMDENVPIADKN